MIGYFILFYFIFYWISLSVGPAEIVISPKEILYEPRVGYCLLLSEK